MLPNNFWKKIVKTDDCWNWVGAKTCGYGVVKINKKTVYAHRLIYKSIKGKIKKGLYIDHICKNRGCVNPDHLRQVTPKINAIENSNSITAICHKKTHCPKGHKYKGRNLIRFKHKNNWHRKCRTCYNALSLARYYKKKNKIILRRDK